MSANNVYDFEKEFHLRFGRNPRPDELWRAATDAAEENSNSSPSGPPTQAKAAEALPEGEICSWCLDSADVEIKVEKGHRFCCRCGRKLPLA